MIADTPRKPVVIIGVGASMRGDDGVGPAAMNALRQDGRIPAEVELVELGGEPTRLLDTWRRRRLAVVLDAVRAGEPAGTIHRVVVGADAMPGWAAGASSHGAGLAEAVELARVLDLLPDRLVVIGVEPAGLTVGTGLSDEVERALPELVALAVAEVAG